MLQDILFPFNPDHVLMGLARYLKDGTINVNNAQHRTVACIIIGITDIPFEGQEHLAWGRVDRRKESAASKTNNFLPLKCGIYRDTSDSNL